MLAEGSAGTEHSGPSLEFRGDWSPETRSMLTKLLVLGREELGGRIPIHYIPLFSPKMFRHCSRGDYCHRGGELISMGLGSKVQEAGNR